MTTPLRLVPYNTTISIGAGFNSYTQQLCINDAVEQAPSKSIDAANPLTAHDKADASRITWTSKFVDNASDIIDAMSLSGAVVIRENGVLDNTSGAFVSVENIKGSDINYLIQVRVITRQFDAKDITEIRSIPGLKSDEFNEVYGDCFISGFIEGGEFNALMSFNVTSEANIPSVKAALELGFKEPKSPEIATGLSKLQKLITDNEVIAWIGDTTQDPADNDWTIESVQEAAFNFPDKVLEFPQRTHAVITSYTALQSYQRLPLKSEPLNYGLAESYTENLLNDFFEYKHILQEIEHASKSLDNTVAVQGGAKSSDLTTYGLTTTSKFDRPRTGYENITSNIAGKSKDNPQPYPLTLVGLQQARRECRAQMNKIAKEVDLIANDPRVVNSESRQRSYLGPHAFRELIPAK
ncbi:hypothetical protein B0O99DRAFT_681004 [Bisporella sp. PMI_857]|nr:hypothetical protein B0O99DRAFT_681004 [Bisporella sp. PMI_857]